jgi:hypothetical protein
LFWAVPSDELHIGWCGLAYLNTPGLEDDGDINKTSLVVSLGAGGQSFEENQALCNGSTVSRWPTGLICEFVY